MPEVFVEDAPIAQSIVRSYMEAQHSPDKIRQILFSRTWYLPGSLRDIWEVEGQLVLKKGFWPWRKEYKYFKIQIDSRNGKIISFDG